MATESEPKSIEEFAEQNKENLLALARVTETAERFEDMCVVMGKLVKQKKKNNENLEVEERNMLSVAYKNVVGQRRASWRTLKADEEETSQKDSPQTTEAYKKLVERELKAKCLEVLDLLESNLVDKEMTPDKVTDENKDEETFHKKVETQVFYLKMCGDYYRYLAEFIEDEQYKKDAKTKYKAALLLAEKALKPTHPTRLGLALNASVCYYEILNQSEEACKLAKAAFDNAIQQLDSLSDATYKDSTLIMQLLRDNLTIWTSEKDNNNVEEAED